MKKFLLAVILAFVSTTAIAADVGNGLDVSGNVSFANDYVWRGVTQTNGNAALSGGLDLGHKSGLYLGAWGSNVVGGSELDVYGGVSNEMFGSGISYDLGAIKYLYPGQGASNFHEAYLGFSVDVGLLSPSVKASHDFGNDASYFEGGLGVDLDAVALDLHYGRTSAHVDDYSVGLSVPVATLDLGVAYHNSDADTSRVVFSLGKTF